MRRILIVEDERAIAEVVEFAAQKAGFETCSAATLSAAALTSTGTYCSVSLLAL